MFPDPNASPRPDSTTPMPSRPEPPRDAALHDTTLHDTTLHDTTLHDTLPDDAASRPSPFAGLGRVGRTILIRIGVAAVVLAALVAFAVVRGAGQSTGTQVFPSAVPSGGRPTGTASSHPGTPFDGTPAAGYPDGVAGLAMPPATAVTGFSQHQVATALARVRDALIAARLDDKMLVGHDPGPFLALLAPGERDDVRKEFATHKSVTYASQIAPGFRLAAFQPKVKGQTTFRTTTSGNDVDELEITTNYVWVYAFAEATGDSLVVMHDKVTWDVPRADEVDEPDQGLWMDRSESYGSNVDCEQIGKGLLAPGTLRPGSTGGAANDPDAMFDPDHSLDIQNTC